MKKIYIGLMLIGLLLLSANTVSGFGDSDEYKLHLIRNSKDYAIYGFKDLEIYYERQGISKWNMPFAIDKSSYGIVSDKELDGRVDNQLSITKDFETNFNPKYKYEILAENNDYYIINYIMEVEPKPKHSTGTCQELETFSIDFVPSIKGIEYMQFEWFDMNWTYRCLINVNESYIYDDLTNFPVLISTSENSDLYDIVNSTGGGDIRFVNWYDNTTIYWHEIEEFSAGGGVVDFSIWLNLTTVYQSVPTYFWMYYGNPSAEGFTPEQESNTWNNEYAAVYHMNSTDTILWDSTLKRHGTKDAADEPAQCIGIIEYGQDFEADDLEKVEATTLDNNNSFTYELWVSPETMSGLYQSLVQDRNKDAAPAATAFYLDTSNIVKLEVTGDSLSSATVVASETWLACSVSDQDYMRIFFNDDIDAADEGYSASLTYDGSSILRLGCSIKGISPFNDKSPLDGIMDEVRISSTNRSNNWLFATYYSQKQSDFIIWGDCGNQTFWEVPDPEEENTNTTNTTTGENNSYALDTQQFTIIILLILFFFAIYKEDNILAVIIHMSIVFMSIIFVTTDILYSWDFLLFVFIFLNGALIFYRSYVEIDNRGLK